MNKGFVMLSRELLDGALYFSERFTRSQAYIDLCMLAAYRERSFFIRGNKITLQPGQLAKSEEELAERWKWSRNTVRRFLNEQQACGNIEQHKSRIISIISIKFGIETEQQNEQQKPTDVEQQFAQQIEQLTRIIDNNKKEIEILKEELTNVSKKKEKSFIPPTVEEVAKFIQESSFHFDAEAFVNFYASKGWLVGKNKMKDWKSACRTWERKKRETMPGLFSSQEQEQPQDTSQQKFYAFNVAFDSQSEADAFFDEQEKIREDLHAGRCRVANNHVEDSIIQGNAVKVIDGIIYDYDD